MLSTADIPAKSPSPSGESASSSAGTSAAADPTPGDLPAEAPLPPVHPTSPWLAAPPNPIRVSTQPSSGRSVTRRITRGGGEFNLSTNEGLRVTLRVPPDSLVSSQELTMEIVTVSDAPFAGGILAAVRLTPETLAVRRAATLTFETRQPVDAAQPLAGIAVRSGEMHMVRADRLVDPKLRGRAHVELPLVRLGTYGVANTSTEELAAANQHAPTDYLARLEQRIARAFPPVGANTPAARSWSLTPTVYAAPFFPVDDLMLSLEAFFNELLVPQFGQLSKEGCDLLRTMGVTNVYFAWSSIANLLLPLQGIPNASPEVLEQEARLRAERRDKLRGFGYSDDDISFIDSMFEKYRDRVEKLNARGDALLEEAIKQEFAKAYRCCVDENARSFYVETMVGAMRLAALQTFTVDADPMAKVEECNCRVSARGDGASNGVGLPVAGTITHTETFEAKKVEQRANRTTTNIISMSYQQTLVLVQNQGGHRYGAAYDVAGSSRTETQLWDKYPCGLNGGYTVTTGTVADDGSTNVDIRPVYNTKDKYTIVYSPITAEGTGTWISHHEDRPCAAFRKIFDKTGDASVYARTVPGQVAIETEADPAHPTDLRGTHEFNVDEAHDIFAKEYGKPRNSKVQWDLHLCVKK